MGGYVNKIFSQAEWNPNNLKQERALGIIADIFGYSTAGKVAIKAAQEAERALPELRGLLQLARSQVKLQHTASAARRRASPPTAGRSAARCTTRSAGGRRCGPTRRRR